MRSTQGGGVVMNGRRLSLIALMGGLILSGCVTQQMSPQADISVGPALSVEGFLRAANAKDLDGMARLFGTADGPVANTGSAFGCMFKRMGSWIGLGDRCIRRQDVEIRMNAIAMILEHDDYRLGGGERVPGRDDLTAMVPVDLDMADGREVEHVPFLVVQTSSGQWLIQEIGLDRVTNTR